MSTIEGAVRDLLVNDATVAGYVSTRIYPNGLPQKCTLPAIAYYTISRPEDHLGVTAWPRIQYTIHASTYDAVVAIRLAVKNALKRYKGTRLGYKIQQIVYLEGGLEIVDSDTGNHSVTIDFKVIYKGET